MVESMKDLERTIDCSGISVCYSDRTNGAGLETRFDFVQSIQRLFPDRVFKRGFEWCSGPSFFGYSLLGLGICETLTLVDVFQPALDQAEKTATQNSLKEKVKTINSNNWENVLESDKFDLIVGNPPHFCLQNYYNEIWTYDQRIYIDPEWQIHRSFFAGAKQHLADDGEIVLMECAWGSGLNTFRNMIEEAGLKIANHFIGEYKHDKLGFPVYYLHVRHK
jgi:methylase of polypeptide subunit release factors